MDIQWKPVPNTNGRYEASNTGLLRTTNWKNSGETRVMKPAIDANGYLRTMIIINGKLKTIKVHRIVAETWLQNPENKPQINHKNCNKSDNRIENLEWCTKKENIDHAIKNGRMKWMGNLPPHKKGSEVGNSKLNEDMVREIRSLYKPRNYTYAMLGAKFGVSPATIKDVIHRRWKHVK